MMVSGSRQSGRSLRSLSAISKEVSDSTQHLFTDNRKGCTSTRPDR